jgi:hypothetical protein
MYIYIDSSSNRSKPITSLFVFFSAFFFLLLSQLARAREMAMVGAVRVMCGAEEERVLGTHKAPGACPRCGGPVVATDVESERRILCLPLCLKSKRKYSCTRCFRRLVTLVS